MVSLNVRGWRRSAVKLGCLLARLPLNQEPSSIYCSQRKSLTLLQENNTRKKKNFFCCFCWILIFQRVFLPVSLSSIMHQLCLCLYFSLFCFSSSRMSCFISVQERRKKKTGLLSDSLCVLCRGFIELRTQQKLTVDSFTLKKAPLCCRSTRGEIIVQYR